MSRIAPQQVNQLAVGCVYLLFNKARLDFPGSTVAHPSLYVVVSRTTHPIVDSGAESQFPFEVPWDIWELGVVPVLQTFRNQPLVGELRRDGYDYWVGQMQVMLTTQLSATGFLLPPTTGTMGTVLVAEGSTGDGLGDAVEPVVGDPAYPVPEREAWPSGNVKLTYPVVR